MYIPLLSMAGEIERQAAPQVNLCCLSAYTYGDTLYRDK